MRWYNEPPAWRVDGDTITATAAPRTDFWRKTHEGLTATFEGLRIVPL